MNEVKGEIHIDAPAEKVWQVISDLAEVQNYADSVARSYYTSSERVGTGAARHCDLLPFGTVDEVITEWEEGRRYVYSIESGGGAPPFKEGFFEWAVRPDKHGSVVSISVRYRLKFGPIGALMDKLMVGPQFRKAMPNLLIGLKHYVETGEAIDKAVLRKVKSQRGAQLAAA